MGTQTQGVCEKTPANKSNSTNNTKKRKLRRQLDQLLRGERFSYQISRNGGIFLSAASGDGVIKLFNSVCGDCGRYYYPEEFGPVFIEPVFYQEWQPGRQRNPFGGWYKEVIMLLCRWCYQHRIENQDR
jgi:hypothetical protein